MPRFFASVLVSAMVLAGCETSMTLGGDDSGGEGVDAGMGVDGARADGAADIDSGSTADDSGATDVDSGSATDDSGAMPGTDASTTDVDGGTMGVTCGASTCGSGEICCVTRGTGGMMVSQTCTTPDDCMGASLSCDGPEDCATGEACCGGVGPGGGGGAMCVDDASCRIGRLCHSDGECMGTDTCCAIMGVSVCSPFCRP